MENTVLELTRENFREHVGQDRIVVIQAWAPGCGACSKFDSTFRLVAERHEQPLFARMNVMTDDGFGELFSIEHTPTLMLFRDGLLLLKQPGVFGEKEFEDILRQAQSVDMDRVKADLRPHEATREVDERNEK